MEFPHAACDRITAAESSFQVTLADASQLAAYAQWAKDRVDCVEAIAEGLRGEQEWSQGHIEVVASLVGHVADMESDNQWTADGEERTGENIVADAQDWGCR